MTISMSESTRTSALPVDIDALVEYLNTASIRLAVFGEFSAGKTTVLNALIGEEILSVAVEPTTAVPTRVRYGREFNIFVERTGGDGPALFEDDPPFWTRFVGRRDTLSTLKKQQGTIRDFLRTWTKEGQRADEVERVVIELPLDWLKGGLELVDTPGVNNEFARHQGFTEQEAGAADLAVLLMDARQGGGKRTEFEFMNEVEAQVERCVVAPNKLDLVPADEREEFLGYIRETALPKHWDGAVTPPVVGISALAVLRPGEHEEPDLVDAFADLRDRLERMAEEERGSLLLARRGNPEKQLFARAKELEADDHYGRAHRLYFDLLDVLEAAGLDPTPAEEGVARCEEHLSAQVDTLDQLNERYNEAMARAAEDPDAALEELTAIRDQKEDLRLKDGDLHASIEELQSRIEKRDAARREIQQIRAQVEQHRHNENWIEAAEASQKIPPLIETAELSAERTDTLRQFVATQMQDRDEWAEKRWMEIKDQADACVEDRRFLDAKEHLDELETVAEYTPFEAETATLVDEVTEKAEIESEYRKNVREAITRAETLVENRVEPEVGRDILSAIQAIKKPYQLLFGSPDLQKATPIHDSDIILTVDQKFDLARQLANLAEYRLEEKPEQIVKQIRERKAFLDAREIGREANQLELFDQYPDHPAFEDTVESLLGATVSFWTPPWRISNLQRVLVDFVESQDNNRLEDKARSRIKLFRIRKKQSSILHLTIVSLMIFSVSFISYSYMSDKSEYKSLQNPITYEDVSSANRLISSSWFYSQEAIKWAKDNSLPDSVITLRQKEFREKYSEWVRDTVMDVASSGNIKNLKNTIRLADAKQRNNIIADISSKKISRGNFLKSIPYVKLIKNKSNRDKLLTKIVDKKIRRRELRSSVKYIDLISSKEARKEKLSRISEVEMERKNYEESVFYASKIKEIRSREEEIKHVLKDDVFKCIGIKSCKDWLENNYGIAKSRYVSRSVLREIKNDIDNSKKENRFSESGILVDENKLKKAKNKIELVQDKTEWDILDSGELASKLRNLLKKAADNEDMVSVRRILTIDSLKIGVSGSIFEKILIDEIGSNTENVRKISQSMYTLDFSYNASSYLSTPLGEAIREESPKDLKVLLSNGANPKYGRPSPLIYILEQEFRDYNREKKLAEMFKILAKKGGVPPGYSYYDMLKKLKRNHDHYSSDYCLLKKEVKQHYSSF